jgi:putative N6-adenine-specific DNA methylase
MAERLDIFATTTRGSEALLAAELRELGARRIRQDRGGVRFRANLTEALGICLWSRIAMRILYPLGAFEAGRAEEIYAAAAQVAWEEHLNASSTFAVEASLRGGEQHHSGFVALKIKDAIADRLRARLGVRPDVDAHAPAVRVVGHLAERLLTLSLDLCGRPLNQRGYRIEPTTAPLKETLAAAILRAIEYDGEQPLVDPMCGSGTILVEAAMIARRRAPNLHRRLAVEHWPFLGEEARRILRDLRLDAERRERRAPHEIIGFDKEERALRAARRNVRTARLSDTIRLSCGDATKLPALPVEPGMVVSNPPYGDRLRGHGQQAMKTFYYHLGESFAELAGWKIALLAGNPAFEGAFHQRPRRRWRLFNGPIACTLLEYQPGANRGKQAVVHERTRARLPHRLGPKQRAHPNRQGSNAGSDRRG